MKKIIVVLAILAIVLTACAKVEFSTDYTKACYDIGGLMGPQGCQAPTCAAVQAPVTPVEDTGWCTAEIVGIPVQTSGECTFCTINYVYDPKGLNPGDVFVVKDTPMEYTAGAYVYQYQEARFLECIAAQPFVSDPGYKPIYK